MHFIIMYGAIDCRAGIWSIDSDYNVTFVRFNSINCINEHALNVFCADFDRIP